MTKYLSGRQRRISIGVSSYTENTNVLDVIGYSTLQDVSIIGISTLGFFTDNIIVDRNLSLGNTSNYYSLSKNIILGAGVTLTIGQGSTLTVDRLNNLDDVVANSLRSKGPLITKNLQVTGVSTFTAGGFNVGSGSSIIVVDSMGELGIGTTLPTSTLHVVGTSRVTGASTIANLSIIPIGSGSSVGGIGVTYYGAGSNLSGIVTTIIAGNNVTISPVGGTGAVTINANVGLGSGSGIGVYDNFPGYIGVATGIDFGTNLTVSPIVSGIITVSSIDYWVPGLVGIYTSTNVGIGTTIANHPLQIGSGTTIVVVDNLGDLGIGTTNPTSKLHVLGGGVFTGVVTASSFSGNATSATSSINVIGGIGSITQLSVSGVSTLGFITAANGFYSGIVTASSFSGNATSATSSTSAINVIGGIGSITQLSVSGVSTLGIVTATTIYGKIRENVVAVSTNYSVQSNDSVILTTENIIVTIPSAIGALGDKYYIKNVGVGTITIQTTGMQLIDNYSELILESTNSAVTLISNGSNWLIF